MKRAIVLLAATLAGCGSGEKQPEGPPPSDEDRIAIRLQAMYASWRRLAVDPQLEKDSTFRDEAEKRVEALRPLLRKRYAALLQGGLAVALDVPAEHADACAALLRARLENFGVHEARVVDFRDRGLVLLVPGGAMERFAKTRTRIHERGLLEFSLEAPLEQVVEWKATGRVPEGCREAQGTPEKFLVETKAVLDGADVKSAEARKGDHGPEAYLEFTESGSARLRETTRANLDRRLAILFDGHVLFAPVIKAEIGGSAVVTGRFTEEEIRDLVELLRLGPLPCPVKIRWEAPFAAPKDGDPFDGCPPLHAWETLMATPLGLAALEETVRPRNAQAFVEMRASLRK